MTNSEAIKSMRNLDDLISITKSEHESVRMAISSLEENDKLKAEIEQLKTELEHVTNLTPKICETCEYEDVPEFEEPCNSCVYCSDWELKGKV